MSRYKIIIKVGTEGGDLELLGLKRSGEWRFKVSTSDFSPTLIDEDPIHSESKPTASWDEALALLGRYPWQHLYPLEVHPEFRAAVWEEITRAQATEGGSHIRLDAWRELCRVEGTQEL